MNLGNLERMAKKQSQCDFTSPEQNKKVRTVAAFDLFQHSHSVKSVIISFARTIITLTLNTGEMLLPGFFVHSARKYNIFYSIHYDRPAMHRLIHDTHSFDWNSKSLLCNCLMENYLLDLLTGSLKRRADPEETTE